MAIPANVERAPAGSGHKAVSGNHSKVTFENGVECLTCLAPCLLAVLFLSCQSLAHSEGLSVTWKRMELGKNGGSVHLKA